MRLTSQSIINFSNINDFQMASQWQIRATDPNILYFQLFDLDNMNTIPYSAPWNGGFFGINQTSPQRYISGVGGSNQPASMTVTFPSLDPSRILVYTATADTSDGSVWHLSLPGYTNAAVAPASGNVVFSLTQGASTWTWTVQNMVAVEIINQGSC